MEVAFSLVMIGLNNSGKSTILKSIKNSTEEIFPTAGFAIEFINIQKIQKPILCYDCSGEGIHRKFWKTFYS
jgi:GTPase SAR1 family protein